MNLAGLLTGVGQAGSDIAGAKLDAEQAKLKDLFDKLNLQQGQTNLAESQERLKKMQVANPELEKQTQLRAAFKNIFKRDPTEDEEKMLFGFPAPPKPPAVKEPTNKEEMWYEAFIRENKRPPNVQEIEAHNKSEQKQTATKLIQKNEYDPSGHLRFASVDPATQQVVAWGGLVPERQAFHYWTDTETGEIHATPMPTMRHPNPGEIQMSEAAQKQWGELEGKESYQTKFKKPSSSSGGAAKSSGDSTVIGHTSPKDTANLKDALKQAQGGYTNYVGAQKNALLKSPKGDLAIVFSAVRAAVEGAGRMTNTELDREIKAGSLGQRWQRAYTQATEGTLPDDQRNDLVDVIRNSWSARAQTAREAWKTVNKDKEMPGFIKDDSDLSDLGPK